jgi:ATP-dependent DNA helicase DinG
VTAALRDRVREAFSKGGSLSESIPRFEPRPGQARMAEAWAAALSRGETFVVEAATGIGKTLAYLVPCVLSGRRTILSTATRTLQQQLVENDIPRLREALGIPFSFVAVKGRGNYLCRRRWDRFVSEPLFEFAREALYFERMKEFVETTRVGDLSECPGIPDDFHAWSEVNARSETCDAASCSETERCFLADVRRRTPAADIVVVNHHLFFAELALRARRVGSGARGGSRDGGGWDVLPPADAVVFDEAHAIEEVASAFFGATVSLGRAQEIVRDIRRAAAREAGPWRSILPLAEEFRRWAEALFRSAAAAEGRFSIAPAGEDRAFEGAVRELARAGAELSLSLSAGPVSRAAAGEASGDAELLRRRVDAFAGDLSSLLSADPSEAVAWGERRGAAVVLYRTPVDVSGLLAAELWDGSRPALLTSATLSVSGDLDYFRRRIGLGAVDAGELIVDNEFDFARNALVYVPAGLPDPGDERFPAAAGREAVEILRSSGGGALILCTSHRTLGALAAVLRDGLPFPLLVQGEAPRSHLLRAFREDTDAVLAGTGTFWEGIDVPGEALRCVVIDKLPFAPPNDPVVTARVQAVRRRGGDPFAEYQVPEAVLALRQGVGRLLRRSDDFGVVALLDRRVLTRTYGAVFRANLPEMRWTRDRSEVAAFFRRFGRARNMNREGSA